MRIKAEVLTAQDNAYTTKSGKDVKEAIVTLLDRCSDAPMRVTFDLAVEGIPASHFNGALRGKTVSVDVIDFEIRQGRLRAQGKIVDAVTDGPKKAA